MKKKKVAILLPWLKMGGTNKIALNFIRELSEYCDVTLVLSEKSGELLSDLPSDVQLIIDEMVDFKKMFVDDIKHFRMGVVVKDFIYYAKIRMGKDSIDNYRYIVDRSRQICDTEFDCAISYHGQSPERLLNLLYRIKSKKRVAWIHGEMAFSEEKCRRLRKYYQQIDHFFFVSKPTQDSFAKVIPFDEEKAIVYYNPIDKQDILEKSLKDGLDLAIDGDLVMAKGTTLGGDNGIAVAYCLALLDSDDIAHPKLEVVLTSDEEVGLLGAVAVDLSMLESKILINLDSEEEGEFLTSCAGGGRANMFLPISRVEKEGIAYKISVEGLTGGHSGMEITKERGNANKLMGRLLWEVRKEAEFHLAELEGGQADNAIPRDCCAVVLVDEADQAAFEAAVNGMGSIFKNEQKVADPELKVVLTNLGVKDAEVLERSSLTQALMVLNMLPNGIQAWSMELEDLVETSLNLGVLKLGRDELRLSSSVRSSVGSKKNHLFSQLRMLLEYVGGTMKVHGEYPAWEYKADSYIRNVFIDTYKEITGKEPEIKAIHAGLECGIFCDKIEGIDCISLGPNMSGVHTTEERLSISSTERTWKLLVEVLKRLK